MPISSTVRVLEGIGRRIGEERAVSELTQAELAEKLAISVRYLQRVEAGEENLTVDTLVKFAKVLKVAPVDFFATPTQPKPRRGRPRKSAR